MSEYDPIEVEPSQGTQLAHDARPHMPEPPPVRLTAVADVHLPAAVGREQDLDRFYVEVLKFVRDDVGEAGTLAYRAENFAIVFDLLEPPIGRDALQATLIEVPSLLELREMLMAAEIPFESIRGVIPGHQHLDLQDPAGNYLNVSEWRAAR